MDSQQHAASATPAPSTQDTLRSEIVNAFPNLTASDVEKYLDMCDRFGIDPRHHSDGGHVLAVAARGNPRLLEPRVITLVTAGGLKLSWPIGVLRGCTTDETLRKIFRVATNEPLPTDMRLNRQERTLSLLDGVVRSFDHITSPR